MSTSGPSLDRLWSNMRAASGHIWGNFGYRRGQLSGSKCSVVTSGCLDNRSNDQPLKRRPTTQRQETRCPSPTIKAMRMLLSQSSSTASVPCTRWREAAPSAKTRLRAFARRRTQGRRSCPPSRQGRATCRWCRRRSRPCLGSGGPSSVHGRECGGCRKHAMHESEIVRLL